MPTHGVLPLGAHVLHRTLPKNPKNLFKPLKKAPTPFLKLAKYRFFTFLEDLAPGDSLRADILAKEGFYLGNDGNKTVNCQFCFTMIPLSELMKDLSNLSGKQIRDWHMRKAKYCSIGKVNAEYLEIAPRGGNYRYESYRLSSLLQASLDTPGLWGTVDNLERCMELAANGFYFVGPGDKVRCAFCRLEISHWEKSDGVQDEHRKYNSDCPFLNGGGCIGNVCIGDEQVELITSDSVPFTVGGGLEVNAMFPSFVEYKHRAKSFDSNWPHHAYLSSARMAACGLFFTGKKDLVACFKCGISLHQWDAKDDPEEVHTRLSHKCSV